MPTRIVLGISSNPALFGADRQPGLVNIVAHKDGVTAHWREGDQVKTTLETFEPFLWLSDPDFLMGLEKSRKPPEYRLEKLESEGHFNYLVRTPTWNYIKRISSHIAKESGLAAGHPRSPQLFVSDQTQQDLMASGRTMFGSMTIEQVRRMQILVYPNEESEDERPDPNQDVIECIALADSTGWSAVLEGPEPEILARFVELVTERDPDILEGHDLFKFHLPFLYHRAHRHDVELRLGREGEKIHYRRSRMFVAEKTLDYNRWYVHGRDLVDSWILTQLYDVSGRELLAFDRYEVARHLGKNLAPRADQSRAQRELAELAGLVRTLCYPYFLQAQIFPFRYEHVILRGNATRINSLFLREYLRQKAAVPPKPEVEDFAGGLTAQEYAGIATDVFHCDVASLYPSIILSYKIRPAGDSLDVFRGMLADLREFRLQARNLEREADNEPDRTFFGGLQTTFKILINSFYGYLGFGQGNFADFEQAAQVTAIGRELLSTMMEWLRARGATLLEVDTDGIYFTLPGDEQTPDGWMEELNAELPAGVKVELDGHYQAMHCHKMKNYALLTHDGQLITRGSGLRSRALEPFLREFQERLILAALQGTPALETVYGETLDRLENGEIPIEQLAKRETLIDSPNSYRRKIESNARNRAAVYELALAARRPMLAGDSLRYYITGEKASVSACDHARRLKDYDASDPDYNLAYYRKKLKDSYKKFAPLLSQAERA